MAQVPATSYESTSLGDVAEFTIPFPFLSRAEVFVTVDGAPVAFTWINDGLVQLAEIPELGAIVRRYRSTEAYVPLHQFSQGVPFLPRYVDRDFKQTLYAVQESVNETAVTAALALDTAEQALDTAQSALDLVDERTQYMVLGPYGPGLYFQTHSQVFSYLGEFYSPGPGITLPYTTTGVGAAEIANFRSVGDAVLRQDLAAPDGAARVFDQVAGAGSISRSMASRNDEDRRPGDFGAAGDGTTNDDAAFTAFEAVVSADPVNLHGRTYVVTAIPSKNAYYNGTWLVGGNRRPAILGRTFLDPSPKMRSIGGQLGDLRRALGDPFQQYTGIVFIGDSITWGTGATGTATPTPRDGTLSDARDVFATASFVNEFKRYIGARYAPLASPILSNHSASPTGQSTAEYQREVIMYPRYGEITLTQDPAGSLSATDVINTSIIGGGQLRLTSGNIAVDFSHTLTFNFTGTDLRMYFSCVATDATFYELLVDGVSQGVFSMKVGATATSGTVVDGKAGAYYDHSFAFVRNKTVTIRTKRNGDAGNRTARFNAIRILKRIVIKNQGINGSSARVYGPNNLSGLYGDGVAVASTDSFVFCQLGTNDRGIPGANQNPRGPNIFRSYLDATLDYLSAHVGVILMCSPPTTNESPASYWLNMTDIRDAIIREAEARSVDFIDNFSTFSDVNMSVVTTDGLHPNDLGYAVMVRNLINSLESAP